MLFATSNAASFAIAVARKPFCQGDAATALLGERSLEFEECSDDEDG